MGFRRVAIFAIFAASLMAADDVTVDVPLSPAKPAQQDRNSKDFVKPFSAPDMLNESKNRGSEQYLEAPSRPPRLEMSKECSIPLLWGRTDSRIDPHSTVPLGPLNFDEMAAPNPAPACKNWPDGRSHTKSFKFSGKGDKKEP